MIPGTVSVPEPPSSSYERLPDNDDSFSGISSLFRTMLIDRRAGWLGTAALPPQLTGRACARPVHTLPITWLLLLGGHRRSRLRGRVFRGRLLYRARELLQPPDLIEARLQIRVLRVAGELSADSVRARSDECEALAADDVGPGDAVQHRPKLVFGLRPAIRLVIQRAGVL